MFKIKKSLLCISAISCMSLYASTIADPIEVITNPMTIGSTPSVPTETDYNYWSTTEDNTYVFNSNNKRWQANNTVTIDNGYTLKLINEYDGYTLYCYNTFTNNGNVIIKDNAYLDIDYYYTDEDTTISDSTNNGTIDIINGVLGLWNSAILNNKGTITLKGSSYIDINYSSTLTNKGTIDISNITDLFYWGNNGIFTLEEGSTFILPKSISTPNRNDFNITLSGSSDKPVNIVIPKGCEYITNINNNNKEDLFNAIEDATGFTFNGNTSNVSFISIKHTLSDITNTKYKHRM